MTLTYGRWPSPISAADVAAGSSKLGDIVVDKATNAIYWTQSIAEEKGRMGIFKYQRDADMTPDQILPQDYNCRSRVHEYGGLAFAVHDDVVYFVNNADQDLYQLSSGAVTRITDRPNSRFADPRYDHNFNRIVAVMETHGEEDHPKVENQLVSVSLSGDITRLDDPDFNAFQDCENYFVSNPEIGPAGGMVYLCWGDCMPWDGTQLIYLQCEDDGTPAGYEVLAGGRQESIVQPRWHGNDIYFCSDRKTEQGDFWSLYRYNQDHQVEPVLNVGADIGWPMWVFGMRSYAILDDGRIYLNPQRGMLWESSLYDPKTGQLESLDFGGASYFEGVEAVGNSIAVKAVSPGLRENAPLSLFLLDVGQEEIDGELLAQAAEPLDQFADVLVAPEIISFESDGQTVEALFYEPRHPDPQAVEDDDVAWMLRPPLLVRCHGGPTASTDTRLDLKTQFWTSRGFAVLDVNYRGSTGYGREFRESLYSEWGRADVKDCLSAAEYVIAQGWVDPKRCVISGSSAGGLTVLNAVTRRDTFAAGASWYGVTDLIALDEETHKFEASYNATLIGPRPECEQRYLERSPCHYADEIYAPIIFFHGNEDAVVPKTQAKELHHKLLTNGVETAFYEYNEGHGFRNPETIVDVLEKELTFYLERLDL